MGFGGLKKLEDRAKLIAYLRTLADSPRRCRNNEIVMRPITKKPGSARLFC